MRPISFLVTAGLFVAFGVVLATRSDRIGTVARRPDGRDSLPVARGLAGVSLLLGLGLFAAQVAV